MKWENLSCSRQSVVLLFFIELVYQISWFCLIPSGSFHILFTNNFPSCREIRQHVSFLLPDVFTIKANPLERLPVFFPFLLLIHNKTHLFEEMHTLLRNTSQQTHHEWKLFFLINDEKPLSFEMCLLDNP